MCVCVYVDTTPPTFDDPEVSYTVVEATSSNGYAYIYNKSCSDVVDGASSITATCVALDSGDDFPLGNSTVTCTCTDAAGNDVEETFTVFVEGKRRRR